MRETQQTGVFQQPDSYQGMNRYSLANISYTSIQFWRSFADRRWALLFTITQLMCAAPSLQVVQSRVAEVQQRCIVLRSAAQRMNRMRRFGRGLRLSNGSVTEGHSFHAKGLPSIRPVVMISW